MSDLKAPTYKYRSPVGRAFTVRQRSFRAETFSKSGSAPKMSDPKAPTYEDHAHKSKILGRLHLFFGQLPLLFEPTLEFGLVLNPAQICGQAVGAVALVGLDALQ